MAKRIRVVLDEKLVKDIDRLVGARQRSSFLAEAAEEKLMRQRQIAALKGGRRRREGRRSSRTQAGIGEMGAETAS